MDKNILSQIESLHIRMYTFVKQAKHLDTSRRWHTHICVVCAVLLAAVFGSFLPWLQGWIKKPMPEAVRVVLVALGVLSCAICILSLVNDLIASKKQKKLRFTGDELISTEDELIKAFNEYKWLFLEDIYESAKDRDEIRPMKSIAFFEDNGMIRAFESGQAGIRLSNGEEDDVRYIRLGSGQIGFVMLPERLTKNKKTFVITEEKL